MNLVYDSAHYSIVAYPVQEGFELVDKATSRSLFVPVSYTHLTLPTSDLV